MARKTKRDVSAQIWNRPYLGEFALPSVKKGTTGISEVDLVDLGALQGWHYPKTQPTGFLGFWVGNWSKNPSWVFGLTELSNAANCFTTATLVR